MRSHAVLAGHPIHQQLVVFPLGLLATAVIFDAIHRVTEVEGWGVASYYMIGAGVIGGLLAAVFGWIDWFAIPSDTRAKRVGLAHGLGNVLVLTLFALAFLIRWNAEGMLPTSTALALEVLGAGIAIVTGWLGGELVDRLGVGVEPSTDLNAPASFQTRLHLHRG